LPWILVKEANTMTSYVVSKVWSVLATGMFLVVIVCAHYWYHGRKARATAKEFLKKHGKHESAFQD
jgi:hypothetical protein